MNKEELKSPFILLCSFLIAASVCFSADFRNNDWGDTPAEVEQHEGEGSACTTSGPFSNYKVFTGSLGYDAMHLGVNSCVLFYFTPEEQLGMGCCGPYDTEVTSFYLWEEGLSDLYGEPENRDEILTDDESVLAIYNGGDAQAVEEGIAKGYFVLARYWETERTYIWLAADATELFNSGVIVYVSYYSKEYFDLFRAEGGKGKPPPRKGEPPWYNTFDE